jgi:hypothetical protein
VLGTVLLVFLLVLFSLFAVVVLHVGGLAVLRARATASTPIFALFFLLVGIAGLVSLWRVLGSATEEGILMVPESMHYGAASLYLGGLVVYVELRSLVSRGYSLRILVDLLNRGGQASLENLKLDYGEGAGIRGMLVRRLNSLAALQLLSFRDDQVGPLTWKGKIFASLGWGMRRILRLERVG